MKKIQGSKLVIIPLDQNNTCNYHSTNIYYKSNNVEYDFNFQLKEDSLLKKIFINKSEKIFMQAINNLYNNNNDCTLKLLRQINKEVDAKFLISILSSDMNEREKLIFEIINTNDPPGKYFHKFEITLKMDIDFSNNIIFSLYPDEIGINILYAEILYYNGYKDKAIQILEKSNLLSEKIICLYLVNLYYEKKEYKKAIQIIQNSKQNSNCAEPINTISLLFLGKLLRKLKIHHSAIDIFRNCKRYNKNRSTDLILEGRYQLGLTYELIGEEKLAIKEYEKILAVNYDYRDVNQRLKQATNNF